MDAKLERKPNRTQAPRKQAPFSGSGRGFQRALLTADFLYSMMTCLTDAPLAQLDRALDYESSGQRFESSRARHNIQGVAAHAVAPFSFDCEAIVKSVRG